MNRITNHLTPHETLAAWAWQEMLLGRYDVCIACIGCDAWLIVQTPETGVGGAGILFLGLW